MEISLVEQQAITARMALIVGAEEFDRLFLGANSPKSKETFYLSLR